MKKLVTLVLAIAMLASLAIPTLGEGEMKGNMSELVSARSETPGVEHVRLLAIE